MNDRGRFSLLGAWALVFGCALGWDALSIPWTTLLPAAGPLGTAIGVLAGGLAMALVAWNFTSSSTAAPAPAASTPTRRPPSASTTASFCAWFLCLTYAAIVWGDAAVLVLVARFALGDVFRVGPSWTVAGPRLRRS